MADEERKIRCVTCRINLSQEDRTKHYRSDWHKYNVRRKAGGKGPLGLQVFQQKIAEHLRQQAIEEQKKNILYKCALCRKTFKSEGQCEQHLQTKKHKAKAKKEGQKLGKTLTVEDMIVSRLIDDDASVSTSSSMPLNSIPLKHCLFCPKVCNTAQNSLEHMLVKHGFSIPFIDAVKDVNKLVEFLGEVIGDQGICTYCGKQFHTLEGIWHHMEAKGHCMIDLPEEDSPLDAFFDFSEIQQQNIERSSRHVVSMNEFDELIMSDGSVIGHRQHAKEYKQNVIPEDTRACVVIPKLTARYRALCMPGYGLPQTQNAEQQHFEYSQKMMKYKSRVEKRANNIKYFKDQYGMIQ